ncbi:MAG: hypothetical protein ACW991_07645, partial [Candidatus Hodarchaeales archaeon]
MKIRRLALLWVIFSVICIISYFTLRELYNANYFAYIGVSLAQIDPYISFGLNFIEFTYIIESALITGIILWNIIFRFSFTGAPQIKFSLEMFQSWIVLSGIEGFLIFYAEVFSVLIRG